MESNNSGNLNNSKLGSINNYILKEEIGEGNFGKMKLGIYKPTGQKYAVKILNKEIIKQKMQNVDFHENEIITKFNHINVINIFELIEDEENYYIIMELCEKGELFDYIVAKQRLSEEEASIFFYQLINGISHIHKKGIAHRDLKPENLLLTNDKVLKIIDFGLSHEFDGNNLLKTKCGSPSYAAPEIIRGKKYDGFKIDIWCCGIILYAMVCGYLPFEGENNKILFKNILLCNPEYPEELSKECINLIKAILVSDPKQRITLEQIKHNSFYLRGKELCKIYYKVNLDERDDDATVNYTHKKNFLSMDDNIINDIDNLNKGNTFAKESRNRKIDLLFSGHKNKKNLNLLFNNRFRQDNKLNSYKFNNSSALKTLKIKNDKYKRNNIFKPFYNPKLGLDLVTFTKPIKSVPKDNQSINLESIHGIKDKSGYSKIVNKYKSLPKESHQSPNYSIMSQKESIKFNKNILLDNNNYTDNTHPLPSNKKYINNLTHDNKNTLGDNANKNNSNDIYLKVDTNKILPSKDDNNNILIKFYNDINININNLNINNNIDGLNKLKNLKFMNNPNSIKFRINNSKNKKNLATYLNNKSVNIIKKKDNIMKNKERGNSYRPKININNLIPKVGRNSNNIKSIDLISNSSNNRHNLKRKIFKNYANSNTNYYRTINNLPNSNQIEIKGTKKNELLKLNLNNDNREKPKLQNVLKYKISFNKYLNTDSQLSNNKEKNRKKGFLPYL